MKETKKLIYVSETDVDIIEIISILENSGKLTVDFFDGDPAILRVEKIKSGEHDV